MERYITEERLYLDAERKRVVREGDPDAAYLLVGAGAEVTPALLDQVGLTPSDLPRRAERKQVASPPADKAVGRREEK